MVESREKVSTCQLRKTRPKPQTPPPNTSETHHSQKTCHNPTSAERRFKALIEVLHGGDAATDKSYEPETQQLVHLLSCLAEAQPTNAGLHGCDWPGRLMSTTVLQHHISRVFVHRGNRAGKGRNTPLPGRVTQGTRYACINPDKHKCDCAN